MDQIKDTWPILAAAAGLAAATVYVTSKSSSSGEVHEEQVRLYENVVIGDVGGTNVRLELIRLYHDSPQHKHVLKPLTKIKSQLYPTFIAAMQEFLKDVEAENRPKIGVVGIAGAVQKNTVMTVNIP